MPITAASTTALSLLDAGDQPIRVHSTYLSGVNLGCGDHLINASTRHYGGVASLCMTTTDVQLLCTQQSWEWRVDALVGIDGRAAIRMDQTAMVYSTSPPPPPMLSLATSGRLSRARQRTGRSSWFDRGAGLDVGLPRFRNAIRNLIGGEIDAAECLSRIVGLGPGLTPSADDALVGVLCLLSAKQVLPPDLREYMARWLRTKGGAATTDVSMSYLRLAVDGEFSTPVARVVGCLTKSSSQGELDESVRALSELGAESGMDTALGVQLACELIIPPPSTPDVS
jgi:hypothetical protein